MEENLGMKGRFHLEVYGNDGKLREIRESKNTVVNAGFAEAAGLLLLDTTGSVNHFDWIALGSNTAATNVTSTALGTELYRTACTGTRSTTTVTNDTAQLSASTSMTASQNITEVGVLNATSSGTMLARTTFSAIAVSNGDTINSVYKVQFS
jgi:hypothetical protein